MNMFKTLIAASLLTVSINTVADVISTGTDVLVTEAAESRQEAFQIGLDRIDELKSITPRELSYEIHAPTNINRYSLHVKDGCYVTVEERMNEDGALDYVGLVNINYGYVSQNGTE